MCCTAVILKFLLSCVLYLTTCYQTLYVWVSSNTIARFNSGPDKIRPLNPHSEMEEQRCRSDYWVWLSESVLFYDNGADTLTRTGLWMLGKCSYLIRVRQWVTANMANLPDFSQTGFEKYPRKVSRNIQYGTAGFRTRWN